MASCLACVLPKLGMFVTWFVNGHTDSNGRRLTHTRDKSHTEMARMIETLSEERSDLLSGLLTEANPHPAIPLRKRKLGLRWLRPLPAPIILPVCVVSVAV